MTLRTGSPNPKIDQNSRQNFILSHRFPRETCRSRQDLQVSKRNLPSRMKSHKVSRAHKVTTLSQTHVDDDWENQHLHARVHLDPSNLTNIKEANLENSLRSTRSCNRSSYRHPEHLQLCYDFWPFWQSWVPSQHQAQVSSTPPLPPDKDRPKLQTKLHPQP